MMRCRLFLRLTMVAMTMLLVDAANSNLHARPVQPGPAAAGIYRIAVLPVFLGSRQPSVDESIDRTLSCPIGEICEGSAAIDPEAGRLLTRMVHDRLQLRLGDRVMPLEPVRLAYAETAMDGSVDTPRSLVKKLGRSLKADFVIVGTLWRYRDRGKVPGNLDSPASVGFALYLVDVQSGRRMWRGIFDESQAPATDHLLQAGKYLKMGMKWLSARELARYGVEQVMKEFPPEETLQSPAVPR